MTRRLSQGRTDVLKSVSAALSKAPRVRFAYVFGSFLTRADARDLDIAVMLAPSAEPLRTTEDLGDALERSIGRKAAVDVRPLNRAAASFAFQVISTGRVLAEKRREERLDWEAHVCSRYQDLKPMLDFYDRSFLAA